MEAVSANEMRNGARVVIRQESFDVVHHDHAWRLYPIDYYKSCQPENFNLAWQIDKIKLALPGLYGIFQTPYDNDTLCFEYPTPEALEMHSARYFSDPVFSRPSYVSVAGSDLLLEAYSARLLDSQLPIATEATMNQHDTIVHALGAAALPRVTIDSFRQMLERACRKNDRELMITLCDAYDLATASYVDIRFSPAVPSLDLLTKVLLLSNRYPDKRPDMPAVCKDLLLKHGHNVYERDDGCQYVLDEYKLLISHRQRVRALLS